MSRAGESLGGGGLAAPSLPELAGVPWRPRADARSLRRRGRLWTLCTTTQTLPLLAGAVVSEGEGRAQQVDELPLDAELVILRRPIAGG